MNSNEDYYLTPREELWRFEVKYRISVFDYHRIRTAILPYMKIDHYTRISSNKKYLVRSLYYDTYNYKLYHEKMSGDHERIKFRLRTYTKDISTDPVIRLEMKVREGNATIKYGTAMTLEEYRHFMHQRHFPDNSNPIQHEFERHAHLWDLQPRVLIEYQREGYETRDKSGLRITFDHRVRGVQSDTLFPASPSFFREFHPHLVVLEIKCRHDQPAWLRDLVREYGLRWVANSKFTQGIQAARHDLCYPNGVVIVR